MAKQLTRANLLPLLFTLLLALAPAPPARAQGLDLQITVFSLGTPKDTIAVAYGKKPSEEELKKDFERLAQQLGSAPPKLRVTHDGGITVAEADLAGLTDWSTGVIRLDPLIQTFRRFGTMRASFFFGGNFRLTAPLGEGVRHPVRWETTVNSAPGATTVDYRIWVDQSRGVPEKVPSTAAAAPTEPGWRFWVGIAAVAVVVAVSVLLIVNVALGQRKAALARAGAGERPVRESSNAD